MMSMLPGEYDYRMYKYKISISINTINITIPSKHIKVLRPVIHGGRNKFPAIRIGYCQRLA